MLVSWGPEQNSGDVSVCVKQHRTRKEGKGRKEGGEGGGGGAVVGNDKKRKSGSLASRWKSFLKRKLVIV